MGEREKHTEWNKQRRDCKGERKRRTSSSKSKATATRKKTHRMRASGRANTRELDSPVVLYWSHNSSAQYLTVRSSLLCTHPAMGVEVLYPLIVWRGERREGGKERWGEERQSRVKKTYWTRGQGGREVEKVRRLNIAVTVWALSLHNVTKFSLFCPLFHAALECLVCKIISLPTE